MATSRRGFMQMGAVSLAAFSNADIDLGTGNRNPNAPYQGVAFLFGPDANRPSPGGSFFRDKTFYAYVYISSDTSARYYKTQEDSAWRGLNRTNRVFIHDESDLPAESGGTHTLEDGTIYSPVGFVTHQYPIELATSSPIVGVHGGTDGFIYTGAGTGRGAAVQGTDANLFMRDCYLHAPGATLFDLSANQSTEMLVESYSTSDAAGLGNVADLGTIDGYRVPTFKGVNFEDFDAGLTFDGSPDKIALFDSPFRDVTASGVNVLTFAGSLSVDIVQIKGCYGKGFQSDTVFANAESGSAPSEVFQLIDTTFDSTVTQSNIMTGDVGLTKVGTYVAGCFPIRDSDTGGSIDDTNAPQTVTGSGSGPVEIGSTNLTTSITNADRTSQPSDGVLQYDARKDLVVRVFATVAVTGSNTEFEFGIAKNGLPAAGRTETRGFISNASQPATVSTVGEFDVEQGDQITTTLENVGGTKDLDVDTLSITI